jgi:hypothetical protein
MSVLWVPDFELDKLHPLPEALLMAMGAIGQPSARGHLAHTLVKSRLAPQAEPWIKNPAAMTPLLDLLKGAGLAQEATRGFWTLTHGARERVCRRAHRKGHLRALAAAGQTAYGSGQVVLDGLGRDLAALRVAFLEGTPEEWVAAQDRVRQNHGVALRLRDPLALICGEPFDAEWFETLPPALQSHAAWALLHDQAVHGVANEPFRQWLDGRSRKGLGPLGPVLELLLLEGRLAEADALLERLKPAQRALTPVALLESALRLVQGDPARAAAGFDAVVAALSQGPRRKAVHLPGLMDLFYLLALVGRGGEAALRTASERLELLGRRQAGDPVGAFHEPLQRLLLHLAGQPQRPDGRPRPDLRGLPRAVELLCGYLSEVRLEAGACTAAAEDLAALPLGLFRRELAEMGRRSGGGLSAAPFPFLDLVQHAESWEKALEALHTVVKPRTDERSRRLAWWVWRDPESRTPYALEPREQRLDARGAWGRGKAIGLKRLKDEGRGMDFLLPQDRVLIGCIREHWKGVELDFEGALKALVGHPVVFWSEGEVDQAQRVEVVAAQPELRVLRRGEVLELRLAPPLGEDEVMVAPDGPRRVRIISITPAHRKLAEILGQGLSVPAKAEAQVLKALGAVAPMVTVHSEAAIRDEAARKAGLTKVAGDGRLHLLLMPFHQGLKAQLRVEPLEGYGYERPGDGCASLLVERRGDKLLVDRNLKAEALAAEALRAALPALPLDEGLTDWMIDDPERCMTLMLELEAVQDRVKVQWPEGGRLNPPVVLGLSAMRMTLKRSGSWFDAEAEVRLDEGVVLSLQELLAATRGGEGRFVQLGQGRCVALAEAFRRRLEDLRALGEDKGRGLRLPGLSVLALDGMEDELGGLKADKGWRALTERLKTAMALEAEVPAGFRAELRSYQLEGYRWMRRLAAANLGACLADDMGLGKTVQTLALLLARAGEGPSLVVAPTSVCANWQQEALKFAPELKVKRFGEGDRGAVLAAAGPFDVLVCSYGLLHSEAERLREVAWATVVLDEGQAIKNAFTKRSQAAMDLRAGFRLLLSGTPVENHLAELWNLFQFLNPGLLGTMEQFRTRFQEPIERSQDPAVLARLRRLVSPFLLRRLKTEVLGELPPRTEITLELEPSEAEATFLEVLRRESLQSLEGASSQAFQVLAALTRLRRACCNPRLVHPDAEIPSSKLEAFLDLVDELRENGHRALVFSQFVDHLALLREALDARGVSYQYLDGSTAARKRAAAVKAFQAGEGELFLISLKAGGTGLNLTAADYVIHMDPWWNPAVEDQASDRAHRMGQTRPVTVYRLVLKGSVEQKIMALHGQKRQMADDLLSESALAASLDTESLMALMRDL